MCCLDLCDLSETESYSSQRNNRSQRYGHTDKTNSSYQWRNGDNSSQKRSTYTRDEYIEPEPEPEHESEGDGHQVRFSLAAMRHLDIRGLMYERCARTKMLRTQCFTLTSGCIKISMRMCGQYHKLCHSAVPNYKVLKLHKCAKIM